MVNLGEAQQHFYPIGSSMEDAFLRTLTENNWMNTAVLIDGEPFATPEECIGKQ